MIFTSFFRALGDLFTPGALKILLKGVGLALALLIAFYIVVAKLVSWLIPDQLTLPFVGEVTWVDSLASGGSVLLMMGLSVFLMAPVASAFIGLFLEEVADDVEARHYPGLPDLAPKPFAQSVEETLRFFGTIIAANLIALALLPFFFFIAPLIFWGMNGYLLSREFFQMVATRRMHPDAAKALYTQNRVMIWTAGVLMAIPLSIPFVNLVIPVLGAASFTHLFHQMTGRK
ncbi:EI24 domain-containing protein [Albirhodobacter sp. R86504]|uniref:EI24 domain-containing protein n=1 Tax=Albirhodobacter sp. R86504 TaxID=3093848 RepID=UPI00367297DE